MAAHTVFGSSDTVRILPHSTWQASANEHAVHSRRYSRAIIRPLELLFGFFPLPAPLMLTMLVLVALFVLVTETANKSFYSRVKKQTA